LVDAFGSGLGGGYDIGCKFGTTLACSALGLHAYELGYRSLVGSFHGHAHNRLCQTSSFLATYVKGMGLEDLEGCKRFFSKSNALALSLHYASIFHQKQNIVEYMKHMDKFEKSQNISMYHMVLICSSCLTYMLGTFLVNNYKQALSILETHDALQKTMNEQGIDGPKVFECWLEEEKAYLLSLAKEPPEETLEMDYYKALLNWKVQEYIVRFSTRVTLITYQRETCHYSQYVVQLHTQ
jgi:hypothetical protein